MTPNQLIAARKQLGLTQAGLAKELGYTLDHVGRLERGVVPIKRVTVLAVAALLKGITLCSQRP
jgi:transcriptional regulator with XRE-family HTH domain